MVSSLCLLDLISDPSSSNQALLAIMNWLNWFLDGSQFFLFPGVKDNKMAETSNDTLSTILDNMHLAHLIENFQREKVTVDQICKLSSEEMDPERYRSFDVDGLSSCFRLLHDRPYACCHRASSSEP